MARKISKSVGDQLFIKVNVKSPWEPARLSDLKALLSDRETPYSAEEKLELPQFGYGRTEGETGNQQIYPTNQIVLELDTPNPDKGELHKEEVFKKWTSIFKSIYNKVLEDEGLPFKIMYLTPSMCGLRFVIRLDKPATNDDEYKSIALAYVNNLKKYGVLEEYLDIKVNCGWFFPTFKAYFARRRGIFSFQPPPTEINLIKALNKAIEYTLRDHAFEEGNRNNFIFSLACNANKYGVDMDLLHKYINDTKYNYNQKEVKATISSAYSKYEQDFGIWKKRVKVVEATVSVKSHIQRAKHSKPIPLIWSGIKEGSLGFVFGPAKSGKSTFLEETRYIFFSKVCISVFSFSS